VHLSFGLGGLLHVAAVPPRKATEVSEGVALDREEARSIGGFADLWKSTVEPQVVRHVYAWRDIFDDLCFGKSLLDLADADGRVHNKFFCGGTGLKVALFAEWRSVLSGPLRSVKIENALWSIVSWLAGKPQEAPALLELARDFFSVRAPTAGQLCYVRALLDGFLLGHEGWDLWALVGNRTRAVPEIEQLNAQHLALTKRFPAVAAFYGQLRTFFWSAVGDNVMTAHHRFNRHDYRRLIDTTIDGLLATVSAVAALTVEETFPGSVIGRLQDWILWQEAGNTKAKFPAAHVEARLKEAFLSSNWTLSE
jgi:hypothetical protein